MSNFYKSTLLLLVICAVPPGLRAQAPAKAPAKSGPDTVTFEDGEKLIGYFEGFVNGAAKFKSDKAGEITIDLSKVQELQSTEKFAVIRKGLKLTKKETDGKVPQGTVSVSQGMVQVNPGNGQPVQSVPLKDVLDIVDQSAFLNAFRSPGIFHAWTGSLTAGASLVEATQNSLSINSSVNLVRVIPTANQNWLPASNRTLVVFSDTYGTVSQPGTPTVKTSIYHAAAERDEDFVDDVFAFGSVAFDHNFSQGLDLQQTYGGGVGWTIIKQAKQRLDVKGSIDYERQSFQIPTADQNLANSVFAQDYSRTFAHGLVLNETISASPAWSNERAYSTYASVGVVFPVYKRFGFSANAIDSFLNDPPPNFKQNSVQFNVGISYTLK